MAGETYKPYPTVHERPIEEGYTLLMFNSHHARGACSDFGNYARFAKLAALVAHRDYAILTEFVG